MRLSSLLVVALAASAAVLAGCGSSVTCGPDTTEENGQCVAATLARCPAGQALSGSQCKPVCGTGTIFQGSECVVGDAVCGAGTELVDGQCRMVDPLSKVTVHEATEPNDTAAKAASFTLPAIGEPAVVLGGVVDAVHDTKADFDGFVFTATPGQRIHVVATAVGAPTIGVVVQPVDPAHPGLLTRYVASFADRGATRDLTLPIGGQWILKVSETSNFDALVSALPRGGANFTYTVAVSTVEAPAAKSLQVPGSAGGSLVAGDVYEIAGNGQSVSLTELALATPEGQLPFNGLRMVWAADNEGHLLLDEHDETSATGTLQPMGPLRLVVPPGGAKLGVDYVLDVGAGGSYTLDASAGSLEEIGIPFDGTRDLADRGAKIFAFDVPANVLLDVDVGNIGYDVDFKMELRDSNFRLVKSTTGYFNAEIKSFVPSGAEGRWFLVALDTDYREDDSDLDFSLSLTGLDANVVGPVDVPGDGTGQGASAGGSTPVLFAVTTKADAVLSLRATGEPGMTVQAQALNKNFDTLTSYTTSAADALIEDIYVKAGTPVMVQVKTSRAGNVTLDVATATPNVTIEVEPNDTRQQAQVLAPVPGGAAADVLASFSSDTESDYFTFTLGDTADVTISTGTGADGGAPDTYVTLYDESGTPIEHDDDSGAGLFSLIQKTALPAGQYYVEAKYAPAGDDFDGIGDYRLSVKVGPTVP